VISLLQAGSVEPVPERGAMALCRADGLIVFAGSGFNHLLQQEWPDWKGPRLPQTLQLSLASVGAAGFTGATIAVSMTRLGEMLFLRASRPSPLMQLSRRELSVARLYGLGHSYKEIARQLDVSPATVRNFLQRIYVKLEIRDKAELAALVARADG
jgi:DNA-binding CsgD family transcriptional regulator